MLPRCVKCSWVYTVHMSPTFNGSSAIQLSNPLTWHANVIYYNYAMKLCTNMYVYLGLIVECNCKNNKSACCTSNIPDAYALVKGGWSHEVLCGVGLCTHHIMVVTSEDTGKEERRERGGPAYASTCTTAIKLTETQLGIKHMLLDTRVVLSCPHITV